MRIFVLNTGRCGSTTFAKAMSHATNYTSAHESRTSKVHGRLDYPDHHVEVDNRLAWFLGEMHERYGNEPLYVHLTRDPAATAESFSERFHGRSSIVRSFGQHIIIKPNVPADGQQRLDISRYCVDTIDANIRLFLRDKTKVVRVQMENFHEGFDRVWTRMGALGDLDAAHAELDVRHNRRRKKGSQRAG